MMQGFRSLGVVWYADREGGDNGRGLQIDVHVYHGISHCLSPGSGRGEVTRDSRPRKSGRVEMKRTSSAAQVLDYDEPQREDNAYSKAKSYVSIM